MRVPCLPSPGHDHLHQVRQGQASVVLGVPPGLTGSSEDIMAAPTKCKECIYHDPIDDEYGRCKEVPPSPSHDDKEAFWPKVKGADLPCSHAKEKP